MLRCQIGPTRKPPPSVSRRATTKARCIPRFHWRCNGFERSLKTRGQSKSIMMMNIPAELRLSKAQFAGALLLPFALVALSCAGSQNKSTKPSNEEANRPVKDEVVEACPCDASGHDDPRHQRRAPPARYLARPARPSWARRCPADAAAGAKPQRGHRPARPRLHRHR